MIPRKKFIQDNKAPEVTILLPGRYRERGGVIARAAWWRGVLVLELPLDTRSPLYEASQARVMGFTLVSMP
jgi:hypothetical protein